MFAKCYLLIRGVPEVLFLGIFKWKFIIHSSILNQMRNFFPFPILSILTKNKTFWCMYGTGRKVQKPTPIQPLPFKRALFSIPCKTPTMNSTYWGIVIRQEGQSLHPFTIPHHYPIIEMMRCLLLARGGLAYLPSSLYSFPPERRDRLCS